MRTERLRRVEGFVRPKRGTFAPATDGPAFTDDVLLVDDETDRVLGCQVSLDPAPVVRSIAAELRQRLRYSIRWEVPGPTTTNERLSGIKAITRVFGYAPPNPLRNQRWTATPTKLAREHPEVANILSDLSLPVWRKFSETVPAEAKAHNDLVRSLIHSDWFYGGAPWTSGIVNKASVLPYHVDRGNVAGSWSAMLMIRRNMNGGFLHLPEYDLTLAVPNLSLTIFDGQATWHGVTPMHGSSRESYRFSIVWYAKQMFTKCGSIAEEIRRGQVAATNRGFG